MQNNGICILSISQVSFSALLLILSPHPMHRSFTQLNRLVSAPKLVSNFTASPPDIMNTQKDLSDFFTFLRGTSLYSLLCLSQLDAPSMLRLCVLWPLEQKC